MPAVTSTITSTCTTLHHCARLCVDSVVRKNLSSLPHMPRAPLSQAAQTAFAKLAHCRVAPNDTGFVGTFDLTLRDRCARKYPGPQLPSQTAATASRRRFRLSWQPSQPRDAREIPALASVPPHCRRTNGQHRATQTLRCTQALTTQEQIRAAGCRGRLI